MYAVVQTGGKQYRVEKGGTIVVDKIENTENKEIILDKVLVVGDNDKVTIGRPMVSGAKVIAEIVEQTKGPKVIVYKKRSKKGYKKWQGHRQKLTELKIKDIVV
jgi:large subunit ribosomal protein L21